MAEVRRPPVLRRRQHVFDVLLDLGEVEGLERLGVIEFLAERVGHSGVLGEDLQVEPVRPPAPVPAALGRDGGHDRARPGSRHRSLHSSLQQRRQDYQTREPLPGSEGVFRQCLRSSIRGTGPSRRPRPRRSRSRGGRLAVRQGAVADGAIDVGDGAARAADDMVVVVPDPRLVARHRVPAGGCAAADPPPSALAARHRRPAGTPPRDPRARDR